MSKKVLIALGIAALLMGGVLAWYWQRNAYSREYMKLEILAPDAAVTGEEITYVVKYKNNSDFSLEQLTVVFDFPVGSVAAEGNQRRVTKELGDIYPGQEQTVEFKGRLFGRQGERKEAKALLWYRPKNISAKYEAQTSSVTLISSSPVSLEWDLPGSAENLKEFDFFLTYDSSSDYPFSDLLVKVEYPEGFELVSSVPASVGSNEWNIGLLNKGQGGKIALRGHLQGNLNEAKTFNATIGSWKDGTFLVLNESARAIEVATPQVLVTQKVNGSSDYVASPGDTLHYEVSFRNLSDQSFQNLSLISTLEGRVLDLSTINASRGRVGQGDASILWDASGVSQLQYLGPGDEGMVEFWIDVKDEWSRVNSREKNFVVRNTVLIQNARNRFDVKVNTQLDLEQKVVHQDETFGNTGPIPPQVGIPTTYTVIWRVDNRYNDARNVVVKAHLPSEVEPTGKQMPESAQLSYNSETREVEWKAGDIIIGAGIQADPISVSFQIKFIPTAGQQGTVPQLVYEARAEGEDVFTSRQISDTAPGVSSALSNDPSVSDDTGKVQ